MKILVISDLHLCDIRNGTGVDEKRLARLAGFIRESSVDAVLNLGDTVSRKEFLREGFPDERSGFEVYLKWRKQFTIPFAEVAIHRELGFFTEIMGTKPDSLFELSEDTALITMLPLGECSIDLLPEQLEFLMNALDRCIGKTVVIGTHSPFEGSCSRIHPKAFVTLPSKVMERVVNFPGKIIWCGGHFHWQPEPPKVTGSLTALYASRFRIDTRDDTTYVSVIDTKKGDVLFEHLPF